MENKLREIKYLYHGTTDKYLQDLIDIEYPLGYPKKDFGQGLYTTTDIVQAKLWAEAKSTPKFAPIVIKYELLYEKIDFKKTNNILFEDACDNWVRFIYDNRRKLYKQGTYDFVYGKVADGKMGKIMMNINKISFDEFKKLISPSKKNGGSVIYWNKIGN